MSFAQTFRSTTCGGSGGGAGRPLYQSFIIDTPYTAGTEITTIPASTLLTGNYNSIILWWQKNFQRPDGEDWTYNSVSGALSLNFDFDPAVENPEFGFVIVDIWYLRS